MHHPDAPNSPTGPSKPRGLRPQTPPGFGPRVASGYMECLGPTPGDFGGAATSTAGWFRVLRWLPTLLGRVWASEMATVRVNGLVSKYRMTHKELLRK